MNKDEISEILRNLHVSDDSLKGTARYFVKYPSQASQIIDLLAEDVYTADPEKKMTLFYLTHELLFCSNRDINYVKAIGKVMKDIVKSIAKSSSYIYSVQLKTLRHLIL